MTGMGQLAGFPPPRLSDRNRFVKETLAGTGEIDCNAPEAVHVLRRAFV
jgi:hypothetical protein